MILLSTLLFLDFSGGEFLLIAVVFLMFFGSKSIPGMARGLGKAIREFKEAAGTVQREIHESSGIDEVKETLQSTTKSITEQTNQAPAQQSIAPTSTDGSKSEQ